MNVIKLLSYVLLLFLILSLPTLSAENKQKILCLHSYDPSYEWQKSIDTAIDRTLLSAAPDIQIYHEYMDVLRIPDPAFQMDLFNYLKSKYRDIRFNVVMASDNNALNFLLDYQDRLMGPVPVVFLGINNYNQSMLRNQSFYTGVAENIDMPDTLKTAIQLMPNIRKFIVYGSWNTTYFENIPVIEKSPNRFMFDYVQLKRFSIPLSALPENSLVINQPESFFNRNKTVVLTILAILCCLIAIIGILSAAIIRRKQAETLLRRSDTKHRAMIANISDVIAIIDINGINRYKSPNIERWFGWSPGDIVGVSTWENVHPDDLERMQVFFGALMGEPNTTGKTECRYRCKDRSYKWIEVTAVNLLHVPDILGVLLNYHDITESKQVDKA
jgi:PAS domain S-box-containing protein